jgi:outer membrane protein OmpA-like peptidoglycan-associated protein
MKLIVSSLIIAATVGVAGCHTEEPRSPEATFPTPIHPPQNPDLGRGAPRFETGELYSLYLGDSIRDVCKGPDPFFKFDMSKPGPRDQPTMQVLVECMTVGPLRGRDIMLVGRTDPRGTEDYNEKLGLERAERVKKFLVTNGADAQHIQTSSLGKDDARPMPKDWAGDRRVQIELVPVSK